MKAIQQLIGYFEEHGQLKPSQLEKLEAKGYWTRYTPRDLPSLVKRIGQSFLFEVTGERHGPIWGTDVYTSDSNLGTVCVHAGVLAPGETGIVKVTMVQPLAVFRGSEQHGVVSATWNTAWPGAYQVALLKTTSCDL
jgi:hypothetical protein